MGKSKELAIALYEYSEQVKKLHEALTEVRQFIFANEPDDEDDFADGYDEGECGHDQVSQDDNSDYRQLVDNQDFDY